MCPSRAERGCCDFSICEMLFERCRAAFFKRTIIPGVARSPMITVASLVFFAAFLLWIAQDRVLRSGYCKRRVGPQLRYKFELIGGGALRAVIGGSFFFLCVGMVLQGKFAGVWIPVIARSDHPFWFWMLTGIFFPSAIGVVYWGLS